MGKETRMRQVQRVGEKHLRLGSREVPQVRKKYRLVTHVHTHMHTESKTTDQRFIDPHYPPHISTPPPHTYKQV